MPAYSPALRDPAVGGRDGVGRDRASISPDGLGPRSRAPLVGGKGGAITIPFAACVMARVMARVMACIMGPALASLMSTKMWGS